MCGRSAETNDLPLPYIWSTISVKEYSLLNQTTFGPGQIDWGDFILGAMPSFINAPFPRCSHKQTFSKTEFNNSVFSACVKLDLDISSTFNFWYCLEAVQIGLSVYSLFENKNPLGQDEPGFPFSARSFVHFSEPVLRRLLNGTPNGDALLK